MKWLIKLQERLTPSEPPSVSEEAKQSYESAKAALSEAHARRAEVRAVSAEAFELRQRNHFGESFERAMMRKEKHA